jgi:putative acyl-CoA dehydrogenase
MGVPRSSTESPRRGTRNGALRDLPRVCYTRGMVHDPAPHGRRVTHEVTNQTPPLVGYDLFSTDAVLVAALRREGAAWAEGRARAFGVACGQPETLALGALANEHTPLLHTHDRYGHRVDVVEFHPSYHALMRLSVGEGLHSSPWREPREGAHVARAAMGMIVSQVEAGHFCPISMTYACIASLRHQPDLLAEWFPRITTTEYDERHRPAAEKRGVLFGMAMTEKQGGSDVRANTTRAEPIGAGGAEYAITGHKWFCSAPMNDAFLVLANAPGGLTCFLLPRFLPDGTKNAFYVQRLKGKLGNRSNASSEIELDGAWARRVGEEGRGVRTIIEMANHTRLDCVIGSSALARQALAQAVHHAHHRSAFGRRLAEQPLMRNVLADMALESEASTTLMMRLARAYDRQGDERQAAFRRIATAVAKFWVCKRAIPLVAEALECLGGNGYAEESGMPRLYRETPVNSVWEGSGNVICLDVLRAMKKEPASFEALMGEIRAGAGGDARLDAFAGALEGDLARATDVEVGARRYVERLAVALEASLLVRFAPPFVADAFCATRLAGDVGHTFGTLPSSVDAAAIVERARPVA